MKNIFFTTFTNFLSLKHTYNNNNKKKKKFRLKKKIVTSYRQPKTGDVVGWWWWLGIVRVGVEDRLINFE